jgi:hypothetical protein
VQTFGHCCLIHSTLHNCFTEKIVASLHSAASNV